MTDQAIAIDLGGTKTSWALVDSTYNILWRKDIRTPKTAEDLLEALRKIIDETVLDCGDVGGVGIGVAGLVDFSSSTIVAAPNLPLRGVSLKETLSVACSIECEIDNDANLAVLGELCAGAARGVDTFIGLTVGTGVGGGIVSGGSLWRGAHGTAAEFGHMIVVRDGILCPCGARGCWEMMASGTALERLAREAVVAEPDSAIGLLFSGDPNLVDGRKLAEAARSGEAEALALFGEIGSWLGVGIGSLINIFNPEIVVIGGGVASSLDLAIDSVRRQVGEIAVDPRAKKTPIVLSELDNSAGLIGAAALILRR